MINEDEVIQNALNEDGIALDITSESILDKNKKSTYRLISNQKAILAGVSVFSKVFKSIDSEIEVKLLSFDGSEINKDDVVAELYGKSFNILRGERTAINFIAYLSGIATETKSLVKLIEGTNCVLLDTRKTTPGLRSFERLAVKAGGGQNHRFNLSDRVLIKDNHIAEVGSVKGAIEAAKKYIVNKIPMEPEFANSNENILIEVEVSNLDELKEAISASPDIIMFDNWNTEDLKNAISLVPSRIKTEASGMINPKTIKSYANTGVNYISTSYMIKNAKWVDFSLECVNNI